VRLSQAICRILRAAGQRLSPARTEVLKVIEWTGNTSPVSIPIVFDQGLAGGRLRAGNLVRMAAIGKGAISGACPVEWGA
jgi:3-oxoacyl-[acyl-carrier-protein] synthase III